jgi:Golgi nucleoside diphosphatase
MWARTPVHLMATAGVRMLPADARERILQEARSALKGSGFLFRPEWARTITGQEEGLFGWVSINYASGALQVRAPAGGAAWRRRSRRGGRRCLWQAVAAGDCGTARSGPGAWNQ